MAPTLTMELRDERERTRSLRDERLRAAEALTTTMMEAREARALLVEILDHDEKFDQVDWVARVTDYLERT